MSNSVRAGAADKSDVVESSHRRSFTDAEISAALDYIEWNEIGDVLTPPI
jgi:hypothetical protein